MPDPLHVSQNKKKMKRAPSKTDIYEDNIVRRARAKAKKKGKGRYSKIAALLPSVVNTLHNNTYGPAALQGVATSPSVGVRTDEGNGWQDKKPGHEREKLSRYPALMLKKAVRVSFGPDSINLPGEGPMASGAWQGAGAGGLAGGAAGGLAGLISGAVNPGYDEETGEKKSRLVAALLRALKYGGMGAAGGAALGAGAGALHGGGFEDAGEYDEYPQIAHELPGILQDAGNKGADLGIGALEAMGMPPGWM